MRLELKGFAPFRSETVIDFTGGDLVAFVGPTGSGKSSVIDAITFALYGSVARYDDARLVAPVIHQLETEARVRLDFEVAGAAYTAVRIVRRTKTGATTKEARLERGDEVLASGAKALDEAVVALLGLEFAQFTRTVVLPQGAFARFLHDEPADRQKLLRRLLDLDVYARMGSLAREEAKRNAQEIDFVERELDRYRDVDAAAVAAAGAQASRLHRAVEDAGPLVDRLAEAERRLVELRTSIGDLDGRLEALAAIRRPDGLAELAAPAREGAETLAAARVALAEARERLADARSEADEAGRPAVWADRLEAERRRRELEHGAADLRERVTVTGDTARAEAEKAAVARSAADRASDVLREARRHADAAHWAADLVVGEPCPVCRRAVDEVPDVDPDEALRTAESEATTADRLARAAERAAAEADREARAAADEERRVAGQLEALGESEHTVDELEAAHLRARQSAALLDEVEAEARRAERAVADAEAVVERTERALAEAWADVRRRRDAVAALGPPEHGDDLLEAWDGLSAWAVEQADETTAQRAEVAEAGQQAARDRAAVETELAALFGALGLERGDDPTAVLRVAAARADAEVERLGERVAERDRLVERVGSLSTERALADALGRHLSAQGFERWLLAEAIDELVERATARLQDLSGGQYSLLGGAAGGFAIVDHRNAEERRDVRTLSGGETFLASLALALALSEGIGRLSSVDSPALGSIFLDEGFGTLDPETLDLVASTIEELSADGRLVGIVTHVRDLADRMPTRFEVRKGPTSSTIQRVEA